MSTSDSRDYELIDRLAEEFGERFRKGERPSIQEYCDKYPSIAADLREMLPALAEVEQVKDEVAAPPVAELPKLRQVDEYHILREVGRGGMGVVYEAEDTRLGRRVGLKVLATGKAGHALERFKREARAAARLHHTNIVPVFGVGDHEGMPYYVMQFIQGLGLDEVLEEVKRLQAKSGSAVMPSAVSARRPRADISAAAVARSLVTGTFDPPAKVEVAETLTHAPAVGRICNPSGGEGRITNPSYDGSGVVSGSAISLPGQSTLSGRKPTYWQSVAQIGLQVADALDYAHKQGILHRDVKPSNLLLDLHGVVWVTDFGLAKAADQEDLTHTGDVLGTLRYMPPEAFEGKSEPRSDVYSLGLSMYELIALRPAYDERKKEQLVKQVTTTDPARLGSLNRAIPRDLRTIVHKAIEKDPDHRYKSAADLAADLRRFLADQTILARRVSPTERFARWCKRNPTVAGLAAAVFLLLLSVASVSSVLLIRIDQKAKEAQAEANRANEEAERASAALLEKNAALEAEAREKQRTQELLGEQFVHRGAQLLADGDMSGAALCYAQALKLDPRDRDRALTHTIRVAAALRDAPRPRHILFHDARVLCSAVSPDGKLLATGCEDNNVHVWDLATGERVGRPLPHEREIQQIAFAAGGKKVWTLTRGKAADEPEVDPETGVVSRAPASFETFLWDRATATVEFTGTRHYTTTFPVADPVTRREWVANLPKPNMLEVIDRDTGKRICPPIEVPERIVWSSGSLRTNRIVVSSQVPQPGKESSPPASRRGYEFRVFDATTGKLVFQPAARSQRTSVDVCGPNDRYFIMTDAVTGAAQWYDLATGAKGPAVAEKGMTADAVVVAPNRRRVVLVFAPRRATGGFAAIEATSLVHVVDAETGTDVAAPFSRGSSTGRAPVGAIRTRRNVQPNLDASRLLADSPEGPQLLHADGTAMTLQPEASTLTRFSPDGGYLFTVGIDNMLRVWNVWTGKPHAARMPHDGPVRSAEFTPDGSYVLVVSGTAVWVWPLMRGDAGHGLVLSNRGRPTIHQSLSHDGSRVLEFEAYKEARVLDATTGQVVAGPVALPANEDRSSWQSVVQIRPDGRAAVWIIREGDGRASPAAERFNRLRMTLWNCDTGKLVVLADRASAGIGSAEFSPDGRFVRTRLPEGEAEDGEDGVRYRLWDASTGEAQGEGVRFRLPLTKGSFGFAEDWGSWSPDSSLVVYHAVNASAGKRIVRRFDSRSGTELLPPMVLDGPQEPGIDFDAEGQRLLTVQGVGRIAGKGPMGNPDTSGRVQLWDLRTGQPIGQPVVGSQLGGNIYSFSGGLNPAGDRIALVMTAGILDRSAGPVADGLSVVLWDPVAGKPAVPPLHHDQRVVGTTFSPDGRWLLTRTLRKVWLWSTATGELLHFLPTSEAIDEAVFSQDGRRVVVATASLVGGGPVGARGTRYALQVWDVRTGQPLTPALRAGVSGPFGASRRLPGTRDWSQTADRLLIGRDGGTAEVYSLVGDERPAADLLALTEVLSTRQVNSAGVMQGLGPAEFRKAWDQVRQRFASEWSAAPVEGGEWSRRNLLPAQARNALSAANLFDSGLVPEQAGQTLWHVDRLLADDPNNPDYHRTRGRSLTFQGQYAAAEAALTRALELKADRPDLIYPVRAAARCALGQWDGAEADLVAYLGLNPGPKSGPGNLNRASLHGTLALVRLQRGDVKGYRAACAELPAPRSFGEGFGVPPVIAARTFWPALLVEDGLPKEKIATILPKAEDFERVGNLSFRGGPEGPFFWVPALRYRQGRFQEAAELFAENATPNRADYYFLAMTQFRLGNPEARATLVKANAMKSEPAPVVTVPGGPVLLTAVAVTSWQRRLIDETLRAEAEALILGKK